MNPNSEGRSSKEARRPKLDCALQRLVRNSDFRLLASFGFWHSILGFFVLLSTIDLQLSTHAQGTAFTYQGRLNDGGALANGSYDMTFALFNGPVIGGLVGGPITNTAIAVSNGLFTTTLDFGTAPWNGQSVWMRIEVRSNASGAAFTFLGPFPQPITPAPYAISAGSLANGAVDTSQLAGGAVTTAKLASDAVTSAKVADGTLQPADLNLGSFSTTFWKVGGNGGTSTDFIGTTDNQPLDVRVNNVRVMRYRLNTDATGNYTNAPNVIGGSPVNSTVTTGVVGATIGGGGGNIAFDGTELDNQVTANFGTVSGGAGNSAAGSYATVGGGYVMSASGDYAAASGGYNNSASGNYSVVPGGRQSTAAGNYSFAAGRRAKADHAGSFVWADSRDVDFPSVFNNGFFVRCQGATIATGIDGSGNVTAGVHLFIDATSWSSVSDRNVKKNFSPVDGKAVLEKLAAVPVQSWNYKWESDTNTPHLGPMAQDFKAAFYPGRDNKTISTLEFDGVELASIQGLNQKLEEQRAELKTKDARITTLEKELSELKQAVKTLSNQKQ
jgi:hypothetical protein